MPYMSHDDVQIHYQIEGPSDAPVLLFSNSLGTSLEMWDPQAEALSSKFQVLRYDTRGHGKSSVPTGPYNIAQLGTDVVCLLDHLDIQRAHVCGLSMGGITAMWLAIHKPERIHQLILSNTAAWIGPSSGWTDRAAAVERNGVASIASAVVSRWLTPAFAQANPDKVVHLEAMLSATSSPGYAANCIAVRDNDLRNEVASIQATTLVISGSADLPTPPADGKFLAAQIPKAQYVELPAAHLSNQEFPIEYTNLLVSFIVNH